MKKVCAHDNDVDHFAPKNHVLAAGTGYFKLTGTSVQFEKTSFSDVEFNKSRRSVRTDWTQSGNYETNKTVNRLLGILSLALVWSVVSASRQRNPPKSVGLFFCLFLKTGDRDAVVGDIIERYRELYKRCGKVRADCYAYGEVLRSTYPLIKGVLRRSSLVVQLGKWIEKFQS